MNLSINELERRLYIQNRQTERLLLLEFEDAWEPAMDLADFDELQPRDLCGVGHASFIPALP